MRDAEGGVFTGDLDGFDGAVNRPIGRAKTA